MRKVKLLFLFFILGFCNFVFSASFDCSKLLSDVENKICSNSELSSLDDNLSKIYKKTLDVTENKEYLKSEQKIWVKKRNECKSIDCLKESYNNRIINLNKNNFNVKANKSVQEEKNSKKYAGVILGENIKNYKSYILASSFYDIRGTGVSYTYAGFVGHVISTKNDNKIDKIDISKSFKIKDEVFELKNSFDSKYNFIEKTEESKIDIFDKKYKQTTYIYDDENTIIKLIIDDYSNFSEVYYFVTLEYITKDLFNEIKAEKELRKTKEEERLNKIKKEAEGL